MRMRFAAFWVFAATIAVSPALPGQNKGEALLQAVQGSRYEEAAQLLEAGAPVDEVDRYGFSPLSYACALEDLRFIPLLQGYGADVRGRRCKEPPLFTAIRHKGHKPVMLLLQAGADPMVTDSLLGNAVTVAARHNKTETLLLLLNRGVPGHLPLHAEPFAGHVAAASGSREALELLIRETGFSPEQPDGQGRTPLHLAAAAGHRAVVEFLLDAGVNPNATDSRLRTALHHALLQGRENTAIALLERRVNPHTPDAAGNFPIHYAVAQGMVVVVQSMPGYGVDLNVPDAGGRSPLRLAAENRDAMLCRVLLWGGASPGQADLPAPLTAILRGKADAETEAALQQAQGSFLGMPYLSWTILTAEPGMAARLIEQGGDPLAMDDNGNTPLHHAARMGQIEVAELLSSRGADLDARNHAGETPLHHAIAHRRIEMAGWLIRRGSRLDVRGAKGEIPLFYAIRAGKRFAVLLVEAGAKPDEVNAHDDWPVHVAVRAEDAEVLAYLLEQGSPVNAVNEDGDSPLHLAARAGQADLVRVLLGNGADVTAENLNGETAADVALREWHTGLVGLLR